MTHPLRDEAMLLLGDLVGFPTVTSESNLDLLDYVAAVLEPHAAGIRLIRSELEPKANLLATIGPATDGGVVLSAHSDVVPADELDWTGAPFVAMRRDQRIYGRGTADMKGFLACALAAAPRLAARELERPIQIAVTFDEEVGCKGAPLLIDDLLAHGPKPAMAIVGEPTEMRIVTAHKGCYEYTTIITGVEGHGSRPHMAHNAVQYAARYVAKLMELADDLEANPPANSPYDPPHTTISAGTIKGGSARNVVAGECILEWEMRPVIRADAQRVLEDLRRFEEDLRGDLGPDCSIATIAEGEVEGLEDDPQSAVLFMMKELLGTDEVDTVPFGTEAGLYQQAGIAAVVCGPGSIDVAHQPDEYVGLDQLEACLEMMEGLGERLSRT